VTIARESTVSVAPNPLRWRALSVLALMQFVIVIDNTIVNVALPSIQQHLHFSVSGLAWVVDGYMLAAGGLLLLGGRIGDLIGHRRLFLAGTFVFGLASIASGVSVDAAMLVISRFAQGIGEAMAAPAALALIAGLFTGKERAKALGIWGGLGGLGATVGVLLSGILVQWADWRWIFLINIPFAVTALVMVPRFLPDERPARRRERPDVAGAVLVTAGLTLVVDALLHAANHGWGGAGTVVPFVVGIGCLIGFGVVETRAASPLAPPSFFHRPVAGRGERGLGAHGRGDGRNVPAADALSAAGAALFGDTYRHCVSPVLPGVRARIRHIGGGDESSRYEGGDGARIRHLHGRHGVDGPDLGRRRLCG